MSWRGQKSDVVFHAQQAAVPGAVVIGRVVPATSAWSETFVVVTIVAGGACAASFDCRHGQRGLGPPLFALAVVGLYFTVPDTEHALVLLGAALPLALSSWPWPLARLGSGGAYAAVGLLAWTAATDGSGRPGAIIGAVASLGLLVAEPISRLLRRPSARPGPRPSPIDRLPNTWLTPLGVGAVQLGVVYLASRVAGLRHDVVSAAAIAGSTLALTTLAGTLTAPARAAGDSGAGGG